MLQKTLLLQGHNKAMSNKLLLVVILVAFLIGAVCGVALKSAVSPKVITIPGETKTEVIVKKVPVKIFQTKYAEVEKPAADSLLKPLLFSFADSIKGTKENVEYNIQHKINKDNDSVKSEWDISVNALLKEFVKEKLTVELKEVEISKPFYADGWFWSTLIAVPLLFLAIIF